MSSNETKCLLYSLSIAGSLSLSCAVYAETGESMGTPTVEPQAHAAAPTAPEQINSADIASSPEASKAPETSRSTEPQKTTQATKDLGGTATSPKNPKGVPVKKVSAKTDKMNKQTAKAMNKIPGVHVQASDLQPPAEDAPITGFHPIKKLMRPVIRLGKGAVEIQQSMMKLEGPIAGLQPSMTSLDHKLTSVDHQMTHMQKQLSGMSGNVNHITSGIDRVGTRVDEVRADIGGMTQQVKHLIIPIHALQTPLHELMEPLKDVTRPMSQVHDQLVELHTMLHWVLVAILVGVLAITLGTPMAAIYVYRNRKKLFPHLRGPGNDLPVENLRDTHLSPV